MHMQDDPVTARLDIENCVREQVAGYRLCQVLGQLPALQFLLLAVAVERLDGICRPPVFLYDFDFGRQVAESTSRRAMVVS